jgi:hypothetical protein
MGARKTSDCGSHLVFNVLKSGYPRCISYVARRADCLIRVSMRVIGDRKP